MRPTRPTRRPALSMGVTVVHGSARNFYETSNAPIGSTCSAHSLSRTCANGALSGSSSFNKSACTEPTAATSEAPSITLTTDPSFESFVFFTDGANMTGYWTSKNAPADARVALYLYGTGGYISELARNLPTSSYTHWYLWTSPESLSAYRIQSNTWYRIYALLYTPSFADPIPELGAGDSTVTTFGTLTSKWSNGSKWFIVHGEGGPAPAPLPPVQ
jgi:hypothetical protein